MTDDLHEIANCEVCGSRDLRPVLDLGLHPMCDDLVPIGDPRVCEEYPIEILFCDHCITAHQRFQIPKHKLFPQSYHFRSRHTADVLNGMRQFVEACETMARQFSGKKILDIGCNDGSLLSFFAERGAKTFGIEPTSAAVDAVERGHIVFNDFLSTEVAMQFVAQHGKPDFITFTNVFAHIEDLKGVIEALKMLSTEQTMIVVENHYLGSILDKHQFDTFYHEHPRTYSYSSFTFIADALGKRIAKVEFPQRYGGNIRVFMTMDDPALEHDQSEELRQIEKHFGTGLEQLSAHIDTWRAKKLAELTAVIKQHGRVTAKAFPGRSAIPIKLLGFDETSISEVFEKSASSKIGHYVPGTRIPIRSDDGFSNWEAPLLNLAWHISAEIEGFMRNRGFTGEFINIIAKEDFEDGA
jgi:SAM-dependent methyltransferase